MKSGFFNLLVLGEEKFMYVYSGYTIRKIRRNSSVVRQFNAMTGTSYQLLDLLVDKDENLYIANGVSTHKLNSDGTVIWSNTNVPAKRIKLGTSIDNDGLYCSTNDRVYKLDTYTGDIIWDYLIPNPDNYYFNDCDVDINGNVYCVSRDRALRILAPDGTLKYEIQQFGNLYLDRVYTSNDGSIYITQRGTNSTIFKVNEYGDKIWSYDDFSSPINAVIGDDFGNVYFATDSIYNRYVKLDSDGNFLGKDSGDQINIRNQVIDLFFERMYEWGY